MDLDALRQKLTPRTKVVFLCSPHNPGGTCWSADELRALATVCAERDLILVSDEIHCDLVFAVRELHWHKEAEWSFMIAGNARITAIDQDGHNFVADVETGDLGSSPPAFRIRSRGSSPDGCEFLLAFADGSFSEDNTFAITDMFAHMPKEALAKNFGVGQDALAKIPSAEKFIFQAELPPALKTDGIEARPVACRTT